MHTVVTPPFSETSFGLVTPSVVLITFDPANIGSAVTLSNGNQTAVISASAMSAFTLQTVAGGKRFFAVHYDGANGTLAGPAIGDPSADKNNFCGETTDSILGRVQGLLRFNATSIDFYSAPSVGDVVHIAADFGAAKKCWIGANGVWSGDPASGTGGGSITGIGAGPYAAGVTLHDAGSQFTISGDTFKPVGFKNWAEA